MAREPTEIAELIAKVFDRLEGQFADAKVLDAVLLVEIDTGEKITDEDTGREFTPTVVLLESTADRMTIQAGIIDFCRETLLGGDGDDDDD